MKKIGLLLAMSVLCFVSFAQKAEISFEKTVHDFGKVPEEQGKAECEFEFTNTGDAPLVLNSVTASCGCTTPSWTKEPVAPGAKGVIKVSYGASGRPGLINKSITVKSNATTATVMLRIAGEVIPRGQLVYDIPAGAALRLSTAAAQFPKVANNKTVSTTVDIMNVSSAAVKPTVEKLPAYIKAVAAPAELKKDERGKITFTFDAAAYGKWGALDETLPVSINGNDVKIAFSGSVIEDFSQVDKKTAPIFQAETRKISFGAIKTNAKKAEKIKINNIGVNPLIFRNIENKNAELSIKELKTINGAKSEFLNIALNTKGIAEGSYKKSFTVQTNDPVNTFVVIDIDYQVTK
jgi:hypothetical protein